MPQSKKTILITGASGGMGKALVDLLTQSGAKLILVDRNGARKKNRTSESIILRYTVDMADYQAVRRLASTLHRKHVKLDWVINLIGYADHAGVLNTQTADRINKLVSVNLLSIIFATRELTPLMQARGGFINISSTAGLRPNGRYAVYSAAKAGVIAFTQAMARAAGDISPANLSFIAVCPGPTNTPMRQKLVGDADMHQPPEVVAKAIQKIIAGSSYRNGDVILVEKGRRRIITRQ